MQQEEMHMGLINEFFDNEGISTVAKKIMVLSPCSLVELARDSGLDSETIINGVSTLIQHDLVSFKKSNSGTILYSFEGKQLFIMYRYRRYLLCLRQKFGGEAEMMADLLLKEGKTTASQIIYASCLKFLEIQEADVEVVTRNYDQHTHLANIFAHLVDSSYIQQCPSAEEHLNKELVKKEESHKFNIKRDIDLKMILDNIRSHMFNKSATSSNDFGKLKFPDHQIYWKMNFDRLHVDLRDSIIRSYICEEMGEHYGIYVDKLFEIFYEDEEDWLSLSKAISEVQLRNKLPDEAHFSFYLEELTSSQGFGFLEVCRDHDMGDYKISMDVAVKKITEKYLASCVESLHGTEAAKVFRYALTDRLIDATDVSYFCLMSPASSSQVLSTLVRHHFLKGIEYKRPAAQIYGKAPSLYTADIHYSVRYLLGVGRRSMLRHMKLNKFLQKHFEPTLLRKARYDVVMESLQSAEMTIENAERLDMAISPEEESLVEKVNTADRSINWMTSKIDEDTFLLQLYLDYVPHVL